MITIAEYPNLKLYWYDDDRTILVGQALSGWSWEHAHKGMIRINDTVSVWSKTQPVYVILDFSDNAHQFPDEGSALKNVREILQNDPQEEALTILVAQANLMGNIVQLASRLYRIADAQSKLRYVTTFERALDVVKEHKLGSN